MVRYSRNSRNKLRNYFTYMQHFISHNKTRPTRTISLGLNIPSPYNCSGGRVSLRKLLSIWPVSSAVGLISFEKYCCIYLFRETMFRQITSSYINKLLERGWRSATSYWNSLPMAYIWAYFDNQDESITALARRLSLTIWLVCNNEKI